MEKSIKPHLTNAGEIKNVLREFKVKFQLDTGEPVETLLVYLPCMNGICDHDKLFEIIKKSIMTKFVLSYKEIEKKLKFKPRIDFDELLSKSVRKLSEHTAKGELGELILFTLLEVYFGAPKILSKISLKTSRRVPVHGADAVHAKFVNNKLRLYLGESKLHKSFSSAATKAVKSIANSTKNFQDEYDLIDSYIDFPGMDDDLAELIIELLNPFSESNLELNKILQFPCFIGFVDGNIMSNNEKEYLGNYKKVASKLVGTFYSKLRSEGNSIDKTALMLLPFSSLDEMVKDFIEYLGIEP